jgi:hypothetical protein
VNTERSYTYPPLSGDLVGYLRAVKVGDSETETSVTVLVSSYHCKKAIGFHGSMFPTDILNMVCMVGNTAEIVHENCR